METVYYAVITGWTPAGERAYGVCKLDKHKRLRDVDAVYVGPASQADLLRHWLHNVSDRLAPGQTAVVLTNHVAARTKPGHVSDFSRVECYYSRDHGLRYRPAKKIVLEAAEKGRIEHENYEQTGEQESERRDKRQAAQA